MNSTPDQEVQQNPQDEPASGIATSIAAPDPFDPESLRLTGDFTTTLGVKKALITVPVRKPANHWFVHVHPDDAYHLDTGLIQLKEEREAYLVHRDLWPELGTESTFSPFKLYTAMTRQGVLFLWPIRLPGPDGRQTDWSQSALEAAEMGRNKWVRVQANMQLGAYEVIFSETLPAPEWPDLPLRDILQIAFKNNFINDMDHPILQKLRGEM